MSIHTSKIAIFDQLEHQNGYNLAKMNMIFRNRSKRATTVQKKMEIQVPKVFHLLVRPNSHGLVYVIWSCWNLFLSTSIARQKILKMTQKYFKPPHSMATFNHNIFKVLRLKVAIGWDSLKYYWGFLRFSVWQYWLTKKIFDNYKWHKLIHVNLA